MRDGPLDMRMDTSSGISAETWINAAEAEEIADVLYLFGEERLSRRIARKIVAAREIEPINSTLRLAEIIKSAFPAKLRHGPKHPATRSFQAIRIKVNAEMEQVANVLEASINVLADEGRLVVISFHSLEDRLVKRFMRDNSRGKQLPREIPIQQVESGGRLSLIGKATKPSADEVGINPRSRSSILRVAQKRPKIAINPS
jgi:16S rRNA (cytosine1402-N4)-methyltransferase